VSQAEPWVVDQRKDPAKPVFISIFGRKNSGKSVLARTWWESWPFDRLAIDPAGDFPAGEDNTVWHHADLPWRWPGATSDDEKRISRSYRPDPGSPSYAEDMDRAIGLMWNADRERPKLLLVDEVGEVTSAAKTMPNYKRILHQNRHRRMSVINAGPRCKDINPLVLMQADLVYIFELPSVMDQQRLAESLGIPLHQLQAALVDLPQFHYLRYDANPDPELAKRLGVDVRDLRLMQMPPVPMRAPKEAPSG
jgi:hypothetical protein